MVTRRKLCNDIASNTVGTTKKNVLHVLSDLATPHNNSLMAALRRSEQIQVITWYAMQYDHALPWENTLGGTHDNFYFHTWRGRLNAFVGILLCGHKDHILLVGYSNLINKIVLLWCVLIGRRFMIWFDHPQEKKGAGKYLRTIAYELVKRFADPIFVVGEHTKKWFGDKNFKPEKLVNLPIFIDLPSDVELATISKSEVREKYNVPKDCIFAVAASRLVYEKGYDLLIAAVSMMQPVLRENLRVLIIGCGPEQANLANQIRQENLEDCIILEKWLSPEEYKEVISSADFFIHPARFDAFGGGTLFAMSYGIPVVGSDGAGTVVERIEHGRNGFIYPVTAVEKLTYYMEQLCQNSELRVSMGQEARETAKAWSPDRGANIIMSSILTGRQHND